MSLIQQWKLGGEVPTDIWCCSSRLALGTVHTSLDLLLKDTLVEGNHPADSQNGDANIASDLRQQSAQNLDTLSA